MKRLLVILALGATACGGSVGTSNDLLVDDNTNSAVIDQESAPVSSAAAQTGDAGTEESPPAAATADTTRQPPDGRPAPDFVLALGQGGEFSPSAEDKPIYMVFWAEW